MVQIHIGLPIYGVEATIDGHPAFNRNIRVGALPTGSTNLWGIRGTADSLACHARDSGGSTHIPRHFRQLSVVMNRHSS